MLKNDKKHNMMITKNANPTCYQCGSELIFVSKETVKPEGTRYPQINTIYRCSNIQCQEKKDKEKVERLKLKQNRETLEKEKMENIAEKRKLGKLAKVSKN